MKVPVGVSARHVHLTKEVYMKLFGNDNLEVMRFLDQPTQFASTSVVNIRCGDFEISNVRVLGPFRDYNQVEISRTDAYKLKVNPPVRKSGNVDGSGPVTIIGPMGEVNLNEGLIIANRHIHITPSDVLKYGLDGIEEVYINIDGEKGGILKNVFLKASEDAEFRLHLDTDDANAFNLKNDDEVEILIERGNKKWN